MKKSILLINCPCWGISTPPLGTASIASYLKNKGFDVELLDLNIEVYHRVDESKKQLWDMANSCHWWNQDEFYGDIRLKLEDEIAHDARRIMAHHADVVGFSVYAPNRYYTRELIRVMHTLGKKTIVVGGRGICDVLERTNFADVEIDYFILGEGEEALAQLLMGKSNIPGLITAHDEEIEPAYIEDVASFSPITYDGLDLSLYAENAVSLLMNRGCCFKCAFCNDWQYIGHLRTRSPQQIMDEISYHYEQNNITRFYFNDQAINANEKALDALCNLLIEASLDIEWIALAIPWKRLTLEMLTKMKRAGCMTLNYGVESGSDRTLKQMNKQLKVCDVEEVLKNTSSVGINAQVNFIVGFPGETEDDFNETKNFIIRNKDLISGIGNLNMCNVVLGSSLKMNYEDYDIVLPEDPAVYDTHWSTSDGKNTFEIRQRRLNELLELVKVEGLFIFTTNRKEGQ